MVKNIFSQWKEISRMLSGKHIYLFLDYDGTLSPIADTPDKAILPEDIKDVLIKLSKVKGVKLAIISGRSLDDVKERTGIPGLVYAGNHGLEIEGPRLKFKKPIYARIEGVLDSLKILLKSSLASIKGVLIEDKGLTLSVHYRLVDKREVSAVKDAVDEAVKPYALKNQLRLVLGKEVIEIRPAVDWDKGKIVLWLIARQRFAVSKKDVLPIYVGDDITDESAFKALKDKGITVAVGTPQETAAEYNLEDTAEVSKFLNGVLDIARGGGDNDHGK